MRTLPTTTLNTGVLRLDDVVLLDIRHIAERLGLPRNQVVDLINRKVLISVKHAGRHMVDEVLVDRYRERMPESG